MLVIKNQTRYELLLSQFKIDSKTPLYKEYNETLERIFTYIYNYTDIMYIEDIDEETLYNYIEYQMKKRNNKNNFVNVIKDVKKFLYFLKNIKKVKTIPDVDLSINSFVYR